MQGREFADANKATELKELFSVFFFNYSVHIIKNIYLYGKIYN